MWNRSLLNIWRKNFINGYFEVMKFPNQGKIFQNVSFDALKCQNKEKPVNIKCQLFTKLLVFFKTEGKQIPSQLMMKIFCLKHNFICVLFVPFG
jgi:hypothetical protein